jgi:hypothetical protein
VLGGAGCALPAAQLETLRVPSANSTSVSPRSPPGSHTVHATRIEEIARPPVLRKTDATSSLHVCAATPSQLTGGPTPAEFQVDSVQALAQVAARTPSHTMRGCRKERLVLPNVND